MFAKIRQNLQLCLNVNNEVLFPWCIFFILFLSSNLPFRFQHYLTTNILLRTFSKIVDIYLTKINALLFTIRRKDFPHTIPSSLWLRKCLQLNLDLLTLYCFSLTRVVKPATQRHYTLHTSKFNFGHFKNIFPVF